MLLRKDVRQVNQSVVASPKDPSASTPADARVAALFRSDGVSSGRVLRPASAPPAARSAAAAPRRTARPPPPPALPAALAALERSPEAAAVERAAAVAALWTPAETVAEAAGSAMTQLASNFEQQD